MTDHPHLTLVANDDANHPTPLPRLRMINRETAAYPFYLSAENGGDSGMPVALVQQERYARVMATAPELVGVMIETLFAIEMVRRDNPSAELLWLDSLIPIMRAKLDKALGPHWEKGHVKP